MPPTETPARSENDLATTRTYDQIPEDLEAGPAILILDDNPLATQTLKLLCEQLETQEPLQIFTSSTILEATEILHHQQIHVMLLDKEIQMGGDLVDNGIEAIPSFLEINPGLQILVVTASRDFSDCVQAMQLGASGFVSKGYPPEIIGSQIKKFIEISRLTSANLRLERMENQSERSLKLPGISPQITALHSKLRAVAETNRPVLLTGETGTGKTVAARIIHEHRKSFLKQEDRPFLAINMGGLNPNIVERELFGHERGAFTDAKESRPGYFELAHNGTLFLDEIGDTPPDLQVKLLKVLDDGKFFRLGGQKEKTSSFKLICATNKNLEELVRAKVFREDLFMRISTFSIRLPSLEERPIDIPSIIQALLPKCSAENNVKVSLQNLPADFIRHLQDDPPPGNFRGVERQLSQLLVYAPRDAKGRPNFSQWKKIPGLVNSNPKLSYKKNPLTLDEMRSRHLEVIGPDFPGLPRFLKEISARVIAEAIQKTPYQQDAAKVLKLSPSVLCQRVKDLKIKKETTE